MKKFQETMRNINTNTQLSVQEKEAMRERIKEYVSFKPVLPETFEAAHKISFFTGYLNTAFAALVLMVVVGSGVSYTASKSLPGDALFGVKTTSEQLRLAVIFNEVDRTEYAINTAYKRLNEKRELGVGNGDIEFANTLVNEAIGVANENIVLLEEKNYAEAEAFRFAFDIGREVRGERAMAFDTNMRKAPVHESKDSIAMVAFESSPARGADMTMTAESSFMEMAPMAAGIGGSIEEAFFEVLPPAPVSSISPEALAILLIKISEEGAKNEYMRDFVIEIKETLARGEYVHAEELVREALRIIESMKVGHILPALEEGDEPFGPSTIEVRTLPF